MLKILLTKDILLDILQDFISEAVSKFPKQSFQRSFTFARQPIRNVTIRINVCVCVCGVCVCVVCVCDVFCVMSQCDSFFLETEIRCYYSVTHFGIRYTESDKHFARGRGLTYKSLTAADLS